jgi:hypothetical protein
MGLFKSKNNPSVTENLTISTVSGWLKSPKKPKLPRKTGYVGLAIIVLVLLGAGWLAWNKKAQQIARDTGCPAEIIQEAAPYLQERTRHTQLKTVVENIKNRKKFDSDANCMYILLTYDLNTNDAKAARADFEKLQKAYNPRKGFSPFFSGYAKSLEELEFEVEFSELKAKERESNVQLMGDQPR